MSKLIITIIAITIITLFGSSFYWSQQQQLNAIPYTPEWVRYVEYGFIAFIVIGFILLGVWALSPDKGNDDEIISELNK